MTRAVVYAPIATAILILIIGLLALLVGQPWLFPSIGPTIFVQTVTPNDASARLWNIAAGHATGIAAGFASVYLFGAQHTKPALSSDLLSIERLLASALALGLMVALQEILKAPHAPAAATTLIVTLGAMPPTVNTVGALVIGVGLAAVFGEISRHIHPSKSRP